MRPILNYATPIWFTQVSSSHLGKHEVIQSKTQRIAPGCYQKVAASYIRAETGVLPLRCNLELYSQQFYAIALQPLHPSHLIVPSPTPAPSELPSSPRSPKGLRVRSDDLNAPSLILGGVLEEGTYPLARRLLRGRMIEEIVRS